MGRWVASSSSSRLHIEFVVQSDRFPGLLGLIEAYLDTLEMEPSELAKIEEYLDLVRKRSDGESDLCYLSVYGSCYFRIVAHCSNVDA